MPGLLRRKNVPKAEAPAAVPQPVAGESLDKSEKFKTNPPRFRNQKVFARVILSSAVFIIVYFTSSKEKTTTLAGIKEMLSLREHKIDCSPESYPSCVPSNCGRFASDNVISELELEKLRELTTNIFKKFFKNDEESSLSFDLHSEALTKHEALAKNIDEVLKSLQPKLIDTLSHRFETAHDSLSLSSPSYVSKITNVTTEFSERLHQLHYDVETSKSVQFTLIIQLSSFKKDFNGGRFFFVDAEKGKKKNNVVVEPKAGRTVGYTAGRENYHFMDKVVDGANYFITLSFTCNKLE